MSIPSSYEGLIQALNVRRIANYQEPKEYTANFEGLVQAILDLNWGQASTGSRPPQWIQVSESYGITPMEGALWFDTRQGRLLVFSNGDWYQTNGGDGYASVQSSQPASPLRGQFWWDPNAQELYVYDEIGWQPVKSDAVVSKTELLSALNGSTDFASFKTNMLALL